MQILFFDSKTETFIRSLRPAAIVKLLRTLNLLERFGHQLGMPHSKSVGGGIFELRVRGIQEVRLLYVFQKDHIVILHGFVKKTDKISSKDLTIAQRNNKLLDTI